MSEEKQQYSFEEVLNKLKSYCAYQERSVLEVESKARELGVFQKDLESFILELEKENYLNEDRFSIVYARSKFNSNHWGKFKIIEGLRNKGISNQLINEALKEINAAEVQAKLNYLISKRITRNDSREKRIRYLLSKGYSMEEISKIKF
jgi:regulatory protein